MSAGLRLRRKLRSLEVARGLLGLVSGNGTDNAVLLALEPVTEAGGQRTVHWATGVEDCTVGGDGGR